VFLCMVILSFLWWLCVLLCRLLLMRMLVSFVSFLIVGLRFIRVFFMCMGM